MRNGSKIHKISYCVEPQTLLLTARARWKRSKSLPRFISFAKNPNQPIFGAAGQPSDPIQRPTILYLVFGHLKEIIFLNGILLAHGYTIVNFSLLTWKKVNLNSKIYKRSLLELSINSKNCIRICKMVKDERENSIKT